MHLASFSSTDVAWKKEKASSSFGCEIWQNVSCLNSRLNKFWNSIPTVCDQGPMESEEERASRNLMRDVPTVQAVTHDAPIFFCHFGSYSTYAEHWLAIRSRDTLTDWPLGSDAYSAIFSHGRQAASEVSEVYHLSARPLPLFAVQPSQHFIWG